MEDHSRQQENSRNGQSSGVAVKTRKVSQCQNPADQFKPEKPNPSYAYFLKELTRNVKDASPTFLVNHQPQGGKAVAEEELVKYMSKLPNYLERGKSPSEKILNFGVLDWSRLEKWQYSQKREQQRSSRHSLSSDNYSPSTFTVGSHSSSGTICSPVQQRGRRPSLQDHLMSSPVDVHSRAANLGGVWATAVDDQTSFRNLPEIKQEKSSRKVVDPKTSLPSRALADDVNRAAIMSMKAKTRSRGDEPTRKTYALPKGEELVPLSVKTDQDLKKSSTCFSPQIPAGVSREGLGSVVPLSCPWPSEAKDHSATKFCSQDAKSISISPEASQSAPRRDAMGFSPTRAHGRTSETKSSLNTRKAAANEPPPGSKVAAEKRSTSPFRRLSIGMSKISKSFSTKEASSVPQSVAADMSTRSDIETAVASICQGSSNCDRQNAGSRARSSSPLRRLLDPLLKPKATISHQTGQPLHANFMSSENARKASNGHSKPGIAQLDERRNRPSASQALLRVAVKNGQPLFTFAVDNEPDILAATMKNLTTPAEDDYGCIYTFFSIQEVKKKNGRWMNQGNNGKGHDYIPNIVAQLKVSGSQFSSLYEKGHVEQSFAREFVLLAVDLQQSDQQTLDIQASNELAAIMVKVPKVIRRSTFSDVHQTEKISDSFENGPSPAQSLFSTIAILPSGIHSLPSKGGPSSLIQRWRSGGSCDCGGWDLGCELKILANNRQHNTRSSSSTTSPEDKLELILQGGDEEVRPVFSLSPFKDGIYSVEFTSLLSILQAFSICIAVLDGKKLCENPKPPREGRASLETALPQKHEAKFPSGTEPAKFVSNPPLSPVGRV